MDNLLLKMHFRGDSVDVRVEHTDRCLLIDVINDMYDEAEKHEMLLPTHPTLAYNFNMKSVTLNNDKDLMEMFNRYFGKKSVDIWIACDSFPSDVLLMAWNLRGNNYGKGDKYNCGKGDQSIVVSDQFDNIMLELMPSPPNVQISNSSFRNCNREKLQVRKPMFIDVTTDASLSPKRSVRLSQTKVSGHNFKIPKATAKLKGIYVPKSRRVENVDEESSKRIPRASRGLFRVDYDDDSDGSETDMSYEPSDNSDVIVDEEAMTDLEAEDNLLVSSLQFVDDGYDPFQKNEWSLDDEGYSSKWYANGEVYDNKELGAIRLRPWMLFMDKEHFKDVLRDFCIQEGFYLIVVKADNMRYTTECANVNCDWRIHASVLPDGVTWAIKSINKADHGCSGVISHNPMANAAWVAKKMVEDTRANPDIPAKSIQDLLMDRFGLQMKLSTLYRMKDHALKEINDGHDESYKLLPRYCEMVKQTNPNSSAMCAWSVMETPEKPLQFKSLFLSFSAQANGLLAGCRSLIGVDGTHLKGNHGGVLLSAVALDGNNELFPIAVGVVESENKHSWSNFFWHLKQVVQDSERSDWTIISDRQKGIEPALDTVWPNAYRRFCARHLCKNFKSDYPGILMHHLFWRVVNATSEFTFKKALELVVQHGGRGCARWFLDLGAKEHWAKHMFDPRICSDENTSNFVESFNSTLGVHRCLPVLSLLEGVRRTAMVRHATRQHTAASWLDDGVCPNIMTMLRVLRKDSRTCHVYNSTIGEYEVHDGRTQLHVSLNKLTCPCGLWQISGIPCKHAIRAIIFANRDPVDYVSEWYSVRRYKAAYAMSIYPIPDKEQWPTFDVPELEPPSLRRSIGRPSRNRRREPGEQRKGKRSITIKCGKCKCVGHNSKTCKGGYTAREKGEMQGKFSKRKAKMSTGSRVNMFESINELERVVMGSSQISENATHVTSTTAMQWPTNNGATSKGTKRQTRE